MAGALRKMAVYLGLMEDDRYDDYDQYDQLDPEEPDRRGDSTRQAGYMSEEPPDAPTASVSRMPTRPPVSVAPTHPAATDSYRIFTLHPRTYNQARTIGEHFRESTPVIMNLTEMDDTDAKRLVDFAAGLVFGLRGSIERVTQKVFLLSPANVEVTAEEKVRIAEGGFFNQS